MLLYLALRYIYHRYLPPKHNDLESRALAVQHRHCMFDTELHDNMTTDGKKAHEPSSTTSQQAPVSPLTSALLRYKYQILAASYITITSFFFYRISRQPFSRSMKTEQAESVFKATTLAAVIGGIGLGGFGRASDSDNPR